jgi:hypothetical protein
MFQLCGINYLELVDYLGIKQEAFISPNNEKE